MIKSSSKPFDRGFTLIELLVVIAIIGILSSVVLASLSTARAKSRDARRIADIDQVRTALEMYNDSLGSYPNNGIAGTGAQSFSATTPSTGSTAGIGVLAPSYIARLPSDPNPSGSYYYCPLTLRSDGSCTGANNAAASSTFYILGSNLERSDNAALKSDADVVTVTGLNGIGASCIAAPGGELCYDITP